MELATAASRRGIAFGLTYAGQQGLLCQTIDLVAKDLGEDVGFLVDVTVEMEPEDGLIWVQGLSEESVMAFTDFGVDSLVELIKIHREMTPRRRCRSRTALSI